MSLNSYLISTHQLQHGNQIKNVGLIALIPMCARRRIKMEISVKENVCLVRTFANVIVKIYK